MKKGLLSLALILLFLLVPAFAFAQDSSLNVGIGISSDNANVTITSGDRSTYGITSGANSKFYINGRDLDSIVENVRNTFTNVEKGRGSAQFSAPPQGFFSRDGAELPMPPAPVVAPAVVSTAPPPALPAAVESGIQELFEISELAAEERQILADALVKAIDIIEELEGEVDQLYASSLTVEPEAPATDPGEVAVEALLEKQGEEIAFLKTRLLVNEIVTLLLLLAALYALIRYRRSIFGRDSSSYIRVTGRASGA